MIILRKAIGSKAGIPTKKGTWGGSYQIEVNKHPSTISCYTCTKYVEEGKSCRHYGMFIPVLGKNSWRTCKNFKLDLNYASEDNISYVKKVKGLGFVEEEKTSIKEIKKDAQKDNNKKKTHKEKTKIVKKRNFHHYLWKILF